MMAFGFNNRGGRPISLREQLSSRIMRARLNLLLVFVLTVVNVFICVGGGGTYFLFSASIPYYITYLGVVLCGMLPAEEYLAAGISPNELFPEGMIAGFVLVAVAITAIYLLAFFLSKKRPAVWILVSLILFAIDTGAMFLIYDIGFDVIVDLLFHAWVLVELVLGLRAENRLKMLPAEEIPADGIPFVNPVSPDDAQNTPPTDEE